jgi:hypothetical protein
MRSFLLRRAPAAAAALLVSATACQDVSAPQPLHPADLREHVVPSLAAQLTPEGRFPATAPEPQPYPQITAEEAREIALAWARIFGPYNRPYLEKGHGRAIDFAALEPVSPVWYAAAVYEPVEPELHHGYRNAFGPHYLLYLGQSGEPVLSMSVAAHTGVRVENGELVYPFESGNDVLAFGARHGQGFGFPVSPEQAVRIASIATGRRAAGAPVLLNPSREYHPPHARWRVTLERPVVARTASGRRVETREFFVGLRGEVVVPTLMQPDTVGGYPLVDGLRLVLQRRADRPVAFERGTPSGE